MGRIPVFLFDDHPWVPYAHTNGSVFHFGFVACLNPATAANPPEAAAATTAGSASLALGNTPGHHTHSSHQHGHHIFANSISEVVLRLAGLSPKHFSHMMPRLAEVRQHYTYEGVLRQIDLLLQDAFGPQGGYLRCVPHPQTERCCG